MKMNGRNRPPGGVYCEQARAATHRLLDGDALADAARDARDAHLAACEACRGHAEDLAAIRRGLAALPGASFPEAATEAVLARTVRASRARRFRGAFGIDPRLAAAAVLALALAGWSLVGDRAKPGGEAPAYTDAELARAAGEARLALSVTSGALQRGERAALRAREVIREEVSTTLREIPLRWPAPERRPERGGDDV